ncbi:shufflon protein B, partial [Escherichia coli]
MSEPEVFHVPDWHWPTCQSGTWRKSNSGSTVITGRIANGQQIPLPTG